jgi:predicted lipid-binding transport protein (Tim44 family)
MTAPSDTEAAVFQVLDRIQRAWRKGPLEDMVPVLDPEIMFVFPGFSMRLIGRDRLVESYRDFNAQARLQSYREDRRTVEGGRNAAVAEVAFDMVYVRDGRVWRAHGVELWALERRAEGWIAFWRTMQELTEEPAPESG